MKLSDVLVGFSAGEVLVLGDVMLDEYVWGEVRRISPEAPVPVVECRRRSYAPGGAGNVAANVAGLEGTVRLGAAVGADEAAENLRVTLRQAGVDTSGLAADPTRPTTTKMRIVAHDQHVVRVDSEIREPLDSKIMDQMMAWAAEHVPRAGACIVSDYNKGVVTSALLTRLMALARDVSCPVIVDPKGTDYSRYRGAEVITPNIPEVERALNITIATEADVRAAGARLVDLLDGAAVLITRGSEGMSLFTGNGRQVDIPTVARNVYDVTGAGDTVVSTLALALSAGAGIENAARIANHAAGIVVGKLGTARVTIAELYADLADDQSA